MATFLSGYPNVIRVNSDTHLELTNEGNYLILCDASGGNLTVNISTVLDGNLVHFVKTDSTTNSVSITGYVDLVLTSDIPFKQVISVPSTTISDGPLIIEPPSGSSTGEDRKVAVSGVDTPGFLAEKLEAGPGVSTQVVSISGSQKVRLEAKVDESSITTNTSDELSIKEEGVQASHLAANIDASSKGFNADKVDNCDVDDSTTSTTTLWSSQKISSELSTKAPLSHSHDDRYYTETEIDNLLAQKASVTHNHDDRYYTETEVDNLLSQKASVTHTHDDRYYTESEVDNLLATKAPLSHSHDDRYYTETEIDNLLSQKASVTHNHDDRYYTETEVDNLLATKASVTHIHDDRYYTETEVDNLLSQKAPLSHSHDDRYYTKSEVDNLLDSVTPGPHTHSITDINIDADVNVQNHVLTNVNAVNFLTSNNSIYSMRMDVPQGLQGRWYVDGLPTVYLSHDFTQHLAPLVASKTTITKDGVFIYAGESDTNLSLSNLISPGGSATLSSLGVTHNPPDDLCRFYTWAFSNTGHIIYSPPTLVAAINFYVLCYIPTLLYSSTLCVCDLVSGTTYQGVIVFQGPSASSLRVVQRGTNAGVVIDLQYVHSPGAWVGIFVHHRCYQDAGRYFADLILRATYLNSNNQVVTSETAYFHDYVGTCTFPQPISRIYLGRSADVASDEYYFNKGRILMFAAYGIGSTYYTPARAFEELTERFIRQQLVSHTSS